MNVQDIYGYIDHIAPFSTQLDYDNAGLLMGSGVAEVERVLVTLDVTFEVAKEAARKKCQLIVSHHPLIFHGLKSVTPGDPTGAVVLELARRNIALISAHTNWDQAAGGVSDVLLERLGIASAGFWSLLEKPRKGPLTAWGRWVSWKRPCRRKSSPGRLELLFTPGARG